MTINFVPEVKIAAIYKKVELVRTVTLQTRFQDDIIFSVYKTEFQAVSNKAHYQGLHVLMKNGATSNDFKEAIIANVHHMLVELQLTNKTFEQIETTDPKAWGRLKEMCTEFVNQSFNLPNVEKDISYNNLISKLVKICMYSAYSMIKHDYDEIKENFWVWTERYELIQEVTEHNWDLLEDIGKSIVIIVPKEKVQTNFFKLFSEKVKCLFKNVQLVGTQFK